jgi:hypothetical protein
MSVTLGKVYLAGRWSRREEFEALGVTLRSLGIEVTSRWLTDPQHRMADDPKSQEFNAELANHDVYDVGQAETLVYFAPAGMRGGSNVEFGMALALKRRLFWIGERSHVFSYLPEVTVFATPEEFIAFVRGTVEAEHARRPRLAVREAGR